MQAFTARAAPGLYVSSVVAAELLGGARSARDRKLLAERVLGDPPGFDRRVLSAIDRKIVASFDRHQGQARW
ncbi:MAG: hypothetical protein QM766_05920 [Burkholderiaceae bacterium]